MIDAEAAAEALMTARRDKRRIARLPTWATSGEIANGYAIQEAYRTRLAAHLGPRIGWKIGCSNASAQAHLGIEEPFFGGIYEQTTRPSPARFPASDFFMTVVEAEIGFRMGEDLPAAAAPFDPDAVADAVASAFPCIEIVDSRYRDWTTIGTAQIIADNGSHGGWVPGDAPADWRAFDLAAVAVTLTANGESVRRGNGSAVMGHPLNALTWLANVRAIYAGRGLESGEVVSTGTMIDIYEARTGDVLVADFGAFGEARLTFD